MAPLSSWIRRFRMPAARAAQRRAAQRIRARPRATPLAAHDKEAASCPSPPRAACLLCLSVVAERGRERDANGEVGVVRGEGQHVRGRGGGGPAELQRLVRAAAAAAVVVDQGAARQERELVGAPGAAARAHHSGARRASAPTCSHSPARRTTALRAGARPTPAATSPCRSSLGHPTASYAMPQPMPLGPLLASLASGQAAPP